MIAKVFKSGNSFALRLPIALKPREGEMRIEVQGERWVVSPIKSAQWPKDFFAEIRLSDPASFERPPQGKHRDSFP